MGDFKDLRELGPSLVMVVSNDSAFFDPLKDALEGRGIRVVREDPTELARRESTHSRAIIVFDADALGEAAALRVRETRSLRPNCVLFVAATRPTKRLVRQFARAGALGFLPKPLDERRTTHAVRAVLHALESDWSRGTGDDDEAREGSSLRPFSDPSREILLVNQRLQSANETLRRQVSQLTILYQMGRDISENENWSDALDRFLMALVSYAKADGAALLLFARDNERLRARSNFQVNEEALGRACAVLGSRWKENPRGSEIHSIESYEETSFSTCLERLAPWHITVVPLRYRNSVWGFLLIEKAYKSGVRFRADYPFLTTIQTILAEEVANASYISDLRQLSRFNQKVLDNTQSGVVTTDLEGYVVFWNHVAVGMCPRLAGGDRVHFDDLFRSAAHAATGIYRAMIDSVEDTRVFEVSYVGERDRDCPGRLSISKMHDDHLNGTVLVGIIEDLTEQKKLEAEVRRTDRLRVLGQLSAGVAHEIRNPLTGIATSAELLAGRLEASDTRLRYVRAILDETSRLDEIVRNLLSFARPAKPQMRACDLAELSERVRSLLSEQAGKKGVELLVRDELGDSVCMGDPNQLVQVLLNLVLNAIEACGQGNVIQIALGKDPGATSADGFAVIAVSDDGPGVPPEIRGRLFEPFVTTKTHGTGLGLAISQQIVEEHRGEIRCEFLEKGAKFTVRLPLGGREAPVLSRSR